MKRVALIIIYNHQYNKNIEVLEQLYAGRFSHIFHLVPFYNGDKPNVIPVYESSYYFQGYVAQGFKHFFNDAFEHYFFIGDDLILNPQINENNYDAKMKLDADSCFIPRLSPINENNRYWANNESALFYNRHSPGVEAVQQLPDAKQAAELLQRHHIATAVLNFGEIWQLPVGGSAWMKRAINEPMFIARYLKARLSNKKYICAYPLVRSYSDIFVVSADAIKMFCHYSGAFAATRLFVELALPTALAFSARKIVTESQIDFKGRALWTDEHFQVLAPYNYNLTSLLNKFPGTYLYIHPVKLSKWK